MKKGKEIYVIPKGKDTSPRSSIIPADRDASKAEKEASSQPLHPLPSRNASTPGIAPSEKIMRIPLQYFQDLERQLIEELKEGKHDRKASESAETSPSIVTSEGFNFDQVSIREAIVLCHFLQEYLDSLSPDQLQRIQTLFSFYKDPDEMLQKIKILFMGDIHIKEKIVRIYASKSVGTFKVALVILHAGELFEELPQDEREGARKNLMKHAEEMLKKIKNLLPRNIQDSMVWDRKSLYPNICHVLREKEPLFTPGHNYALIVERFREFIFWLFGNPYLLSYLEWKQKYLKYWLYTELHDLDVQNIATGEMGVPKYNTIKVNAYQKLAQLFEPLSKEDMKVNRELFLRKHHYTTLIQKEAFLPNASSANKVALKRARDTEKTLLDSLTYNQLTTLAAAVHTGMLRAKADQELRGELPSNTNTRSVDIESDNKSEQKYTAATIKAHVEQAKKSKPLFPKLLENLSKFAQGLGLLHKNDESLRPEKDAVPRAFEGMGNVLEPATPNWFGYGREYKSTIYENKIPNLQKNFFDQGSLKLYIYEEFVACAEAIYQFYGELGYIRFAKHKIDRVIAGRETSDEIEDSAIYLKTEEDTFLAIGKTIFGKAPEPSIYFQIYRKDPIKPYMGTSQNVDFSRMVDGVSFNMENHEFPTQIRPILFQSLIRVIDSLPDELRNKHLKLLKRIHSFLDEKP